MERPRDLVVELFVMAAIGLVLGLLGPFGSFALPAGRRVPLWLLLALAGYACFRPVLAAGLLLHVRTGVPRLAAVAIACALAAVPTAAAVAAIFAYAGLARWDVDRAAALYGQSLLVGGLATAIQLALATRGRAAAAGPVPAAGERPPAAPEPPPPATSVTPPPTPPAQPDPPAFLDRLPPDRRGPLLCLEMEDHYVRAHTARGSALVLMRMRDAVAELGGIEGLRVHRSWWVARGAVAVVVRRERAVLLRLANGLEVPVARAGCKPARNAVPELRAAGWL